VWRRGRWGHGRFPLDDLPSVWRRCLPTTPVLVHLIAVPSRVAVAVRLHPALAETVVRDRNMPHHGAMHQVGALLYVRRRDAFTSGRDRGSLGGLCRRHGWRARHRSFSALGSLGRPSCSSDWWQLQRRNKWTSLRAAHSRCCGCSSCNCRPGQCCGGDRGGRGGCGGCQNGSGARI